MVIGRFAPSPTGPLHAGSLVAALASWLDARALGGRWLVRIEDLDTPRGVPGADTLILSQLATCGLVPDAAPVWQSGRSHLYARALDDLTDRGLAYACACSRKDIEAAWAARGVVRPRHGELVYPGTCRQGLAGRAPRAWRLRVDIDGSKPASALVTAAQGAINLIADSSITWDDRRLGRQQQDVAAEVGDFVLRRADGLWAYQLAVVVDDAAQGVTDVVRGGDLLGATGWQLALQQALSLPTPRYLHLPVVTEPGGGKLAKSRRSLPLDTGAAPALLYRALQLLGQAPPEGLERSGLAATWEWALAHWDPRAAARHHEVVA